jgi:hypothetical protein
MRPGENQRRTRRNRIRSAHASGPVDKEILATGAVCSNLIRMEIERRNRLLMPFLRTQDRFFRTLGDSLDPEWMPSGRETHFRERNGAVSVSWRPTGAGFLNRREMLLTFSKFCAVWRRMPLQRASHLGKINREQLRTLCAPTSAVSSELLISLCSSWLAETRTVERATA